MFSPLLFTIPSSHNIRLYKFFHYWQGYWIEEESEGCIDGQQEASRVDPRQYFRCIRGDWVILFCDEGWTYNDLYKSCQVSEYPGSCPSICLAACGFVGFLTYQTRSTTPFRSIFVWRLLAYLEVKPIYITDEIYWEMKWLMCLLLRQIWYLWVSS